MSFSIQGTRKALLVLHLHIIIIIIRKQIQIPLNCDILRQIIISLRVILHGDQILLGIDRGLLCRVYGLCSCLYMQISRNIGTYQCQCHHKSCHFFHKHFLRCVHFSDFWHIWSDVHSLREYSTTF